MVFVFYDRFLELCKEKGVKPTNACVEAGLSRGLAAKWKSTKTEKPSADALEKMSAYFKKSIEELIKILECPHYTPQNLEDKILFPAFHEMLNKKECVYAFKYRFVKEKAEGRKGRKGFAEIEFKIYDKRKSNFYEEFYNDDWQDRVKQDEQNK